MSLTINIATRGRPELLRKTIEASLPNMVRSDTVLMVSIDDDDKETVASLEGLPIDDRIHISVKPREDSRGEKYDRALKEAPASVYLPAVDCAPFLTPRFDEKILEAANLFPDNIGCVYTPMANSSFPSLQAPTAGLVKKLGHIYNHEYPFWFIDHELDDICRMIGRFVFVDVNVSHRPWRPGTTIRLRDLEFWTSYYDLMTLERRLKARAIIMSPEFQAPDWQRKVLANSYQVVESRSRQINASVRQNAAAIEEQRGDKNPPDEGYLRAKAKAETKLSQFLQTLKAA